MYCLTHMEAVAFILKNKTTIKGLGGFCLMVQQCFGC